MTDIEILEAIHKDRIAEIGKRYDVKEIDSWFSSKENNYKAQITIKDLKAMFTTTDFNAISFEEARKYLIK